MNLPIRLPRRTRTLVDLLLIFLLAAVLIRPYFKARYTDKWASIESTFVADARFLKDHWPHPQWQPLWYTGTRFDYVYPPALRYGTAGLSKLFGWLPVKAYHFYTAVFYCLGITGVYFLIWVGTRSRAPAALGAVAAALMSPSFLFMKNMRDDAWKLLPIRLGVLSKYGEGPHMTALALIPFALAFSWRALEDRRPVSIGLAGIFSAAVVLNNFYGATALATLYPILVWAFWITRQDTRIAMPAAAIPALAYGLAAFWLVPSYLSVTVHNLVYVSERGTKWSLWIAVVVAMAYAVATDRYAKARRERTWPVFVLGALVFFSLNVLGNYWFNFRVIGEPGRLIPELDMIFIMSALLGLGWLWRRPHPGAHWVAGLVVAAAFATTLGYIRHAWHMFPLWPDHSTRVEYRVTDWLAKNMPDARVNSSGTVRFWFDAWYDLAELGGGSEQGLLNPMVQPAQWEIMSGKEPEPARLWMQALGTEVMYVADKRSEEPYKDIQNPERFSRTMPLLWDDGKGNTLYRVPRRWPQRVRVVDAAQLAAQQPPRTNDDVERLRAYVEVIEKGPDSPATLARRGTDGMTLRATLAPGQAVVVQETYDPAWQASIGGRPVPLHADAYGFMVVDAPAGKHEIQLDFVTPLENQLGRGLTLLTWLAIAGLMVADRGAGKAA